MAIDWLSLMKAVLSVVDEVLDTFLADAQGKPQPQTQAIPQPQAQTTPYVQPNQYTVMPQPQAQATPDSFQSGNSTIGPMVGRSVA